MAGLVWFVAAFRWELLGVLLVVSGFQIIFAQPPCSKDRKHFTRIVSIEEAEAENMEVHTSSEPTPVPFGSANPQWRELLAKRQSGDLLWEFYSAEEWVDGRVGRAGVALVRSGKVVSLILSAPRRSRVTSGGWRGFRGRRRYVCAKRADDTARLPSQSYGPRQPRGLATRCTSSVQPKPLSKAVTVPSTSTTAN